MLKVKQLLNLTPGKVRYRASYPRVRKIEDKEKKHYRNVFYRVALGNVESTGDSYNCLVRVHGSDDEFGYKMTPETEVWVHCSCPYFTYHLEVVLKLKGSSEIYNSNGAYPRITNPSLRPYLCKHLYALTLYLLAQDKKRKA